uniref:Jacalin-related lectin-like protein n=1 Tax=Halisarca dujardinii TaxID=2583056 RepID=A0AA96MKL5_HALDU|nr:jacalin-related lectin-like protein [Halisarca dujardinii]
MAFTTAIGCITVVALLAISSVESYPFPVYYTVWYGSSKGYHFNDYTTHGLSSPSVVGVDKIYIRYKSTDVLAVQFTYRLSNGNCQMGSYHGGGTEYEGSDSFISLSKDEYVSRMSGRSNRNIYYLHFIIRNSITGRTRSYGYGYNQGGQHFTIAGPIYAIYGHAGSRVYYLGAYLPTPTTELYGYVDGSGFWDSVTSHFPAITRLQQVIGCITILALLAISSVESYPFPVYNTVWYGSSKGYHFNDYTRHGLSSTSVVGVDKIYIHYKSTDVLAVQFTYRLSNGGCQLGYYHGDGAEGGGSNSIISLSKDEYVARISGRYEITIRYLQFVIQNSITGRTRSYSYGYNRGQHFTIAGPIYAIYGHSGSRIDNLGVYLSTPATELHGYIRGTGFWDPVTSHFPAITRLQQVCIRSGADIDSVLFTYLTTTGSYTSGRYGGGGGGEGCFTLESYERISSVQIYKSETKGGVIIGLQFTISSSTSVRTYVQGPFGRLSGDGITLRRDTGVLGFYGYYTSTRLTGLGLIGH